jgi:hypothetical protein
VRQAGRHRAERGEPLAVLLDLGDPGHDRRDLPHDALMDRCLLARDAAEVVAGEPCDPAPRLGHHAHADRGLGQHRDRARPGRRALAPDRLGARAVDEQGLRGPFQQQHHRLRLLALADELLAGLGIVRHRHRGPLGELLVAEVVEQVDEAQVGDRDAHVSERYWCTSDTAIEPSPTALATRLIERARTSPATNTPGTVVSSR